jgi:predicted dehydrogenase
VKVGLVGLGGNGRAFVKAYMTNPKAQLVAVCDMWDARVEETRRTTGYAGPAYADLDEMLAKSSLDMLSVHTSDHQHAEPFVKALQAGKHAFVEKPMGNTIEDLNRMTAAAAQSDRKTMVGQILRFNPFFQKAKQLCDAGALGRIFYAEADYIHSLFQQGDAARVNPHTGINWYLEKEIPIVGGGVHPFDLLRWFTRANAVRVKGFCNRIAFPQMKNADCQVALFDMSDGSIAKVAAAYGVVGQRPAFNNLVIHGTEGTVRGGKLLRGRHGHFTEEDLTVTYTGHPFEPESDHFLQCILEDKPTLVDAFDAANSAAACIVAAQAAAAGRTLRVPQYARQR